MSDLDVAKRTLLAELREHALVIGEVTLASGAQAQCYVGGGCCCGPSASGRPES